MKKLFTFALLSMALGFTACSDDDTPEGTTTTEVSAADLDYSPENAEQWGNYMVVVGTLLQQDANSLYTHWTSSSNSRYGEAFSNIFKSHNNSYYNSAFACVEEIIDGAEGIADEVGNAKIGEPYDFYMSGDITRAVYAVESWYSWHSRVDYRNNIYSIRNAFYGSLDGSIHEKSLAKLLQTKNPALAQETINKINAAANAIWAIPQPFRNNINSNESRVAMSACQDLADFLANELKAEFTPENYTEAELNPIINQYVDGVVLPTYKSLNEKNKALCDAVKAFQKSPSNEAFKACAEAWLAAREPWEQSEAFLFGPVDDLGLDPNMDSWPLDQSGIVNILQSSAFKNLEWTGDYEALDEEDEDASSEHAKAIAKAQNLRGFHTLEFFIFKNGEVRTVN